jgi:hypothetical protein
MLPCGAEICQITKRRYKAANWTFYVYLAGWCNPWYIMPVEPPGAEAPPVPPGTHVQTGFGTYIPAKDAQFKHGFYWNKSDHELTIELRCYRIATPTSQMGLGKAGHFREAVNLIWGEQNEQKRFIWHPWAEKMLEESCIHKYLSVAGCANSGKSDFYAVYAIINWLADPANTMVLITSTSLKESRGRIWGAIEEYWNAAQRMFNDELPGKLVSSVGVIKLEDPNYKTSDRSGIHLIAGEKKKEKDSIGKLIGLKNQRVIFVADELPELSHAILEAAFSNLDANPEFQLIGIGNPNSIYDPHGVFSKPKDGWKSVTSAHHEWETERGYCIRFDAYQSPNVLAGETIYKFLPTVAKIEAKKHELGEDSLAFWRMWRGYWCPTGGSESVISEADIVGYDCEEHVKRWKVPPILVSFLDPGFTNGGDRSISSFALFGVNADTEKWTLDFQEYVPIFEDTTNKKIARNYQVVHQWKKLCEDRKITPDRAAFDDTGASAFGDIVHTEWSRLVTRINFGGKASTLRVSAHDKTLACDKYVNRVTEIWGSMREYIRCGQIRGIDPDSGVELTSRRMWHKKDRGPDLRSQVEPKPVMRGRTGKSPDIGDARCGTLDLLRSKFHFRAAVKEKMNEKSNKDWKSFRKKKDPSQHYQVIDRTA